MGTERGTVELTGTPRKVAFPQACASCGTPAGRRLRIEKVFERKAYSVKVYGLAVPFCTTCIERHRSEVEHQPPGPRLVSYFRSPLLIAAFAFVAVALFLLPRFADDVADGKVKNSLVLLAFLLLFVLLGIGSARLARNRTRRYRVSEPTSVTAAFDFSDDVSGAYERERHSYTMTNPRFAESFVAVNASKVWDGRRRKARAADRGRSVVLLLAVVGGLAVAGWLGVSALRG